MEKAKTERLGEFLGRGGGGGGGGGILTDGARRRGCHRARQTQSRERFPRKLCGRRVRGGGQCEATGGQCEGVIPNARVTKTAANELGRVREA